MGKQAFETESRINGFGFDPDTEVLIPGVDCKGPGHPMFQPETVDYFNRLKAGEFAADVADFVARGSIVPGEVVKDKESGKAIPVQGRKRVLLLRAANKIRKELGQEPWPFNALVLARGTKQAEAMLRTISENTGRYQLNARELAEIAFNFLQMNGDTEQTRHDLCVSLRISETRLDSVLGLREASPTIHKAIDNGELKMSAAIMLAKLPVQDQAAKLAELKTQARAEGKKTVTTEAARASGSGKRPRPSARVIERVCALLHAQGATGDMLDILRFCVGAVGVEKTPPAFRNAYNTVREGKDKDEIKEIKREAKKRSRK